VLLLPTSLRAFGTRRPAAWNGRAARPAKARAVLRSLRSSKRQLGQSPLAPSQARSQNQLTARPRSRRSFLGGSQLTRPPSRARRSAHPHGALDRRYPVDISRAKLVGFRRNCDLSASSHEPRRAVSLTSSRTEVIEYWGAVCGSGGRPYAHSIDRNLEEF